MTTIRKKKLELDLSLLTPNLLHNAIGPPQSKSWNDIPHDMAVCSSCLWNGPLKTCTTYSDSEGWEYPSYTVFVCPVCELGGEDGEVESFSSILMAFDEAEFNRNIRVHLPEDVTPARQIKLRHKKAPVR